MVPGEIMEQALSEQIYGLMKEKKFTENSQHT